MRLKKFFFVKLSNYITFCAKYSHQCRKSDPSSFARPRSQPVGPSRESGGILPGPCATIYTNQSVLDYGPSDRVYGSYRFYAVIVREFRPFSSQLGFNEYIYLIRIIYNVLGRDYATMEISMNR